MPRQFTTLFLFIGLTFVGFQSCTTTKDDNQLISLQHQIDSLQSLLESKPIISPSGKIKHLVLLDLKDGLSTQERATVLDAIENLVNIKSVENLQFGFFKDLNDDRALKDFELIMQMEFQNPEQYKIYQAHPIHLELKKALGSLLAGPPVTYDFTIE